MNPSQRIEIPTLAHSSQRLNSSPFMKDVPGIPLMYRPYEFYEYNSAHWTGFPTAKDPSAPPMFQGAGVAYIRCQGSIVAVGILLAGRFLTSESAAIEAVQQTVLLDANVNKCAKIDDVANGALKRHAWG